MMGPARTNSGKIFTPNRHKSSFFNFKFKTKKFIAPSTCFDSSKTHFLQHTGLRTCPCCGVFLVVVKIENCFEKNHIQPTTPPPVQAHLVVQFCWSTKNAAKGTNIHCNQIKDSTMCEIMCEINSNILFVSYFEPLCGPSVHMICVRHPCTEPWVAMLIFSVSHELPRTSHIPWNASTTSDTPP